LISSPVPDLAATLTTQADDLPNDVALSFLRTRLEGNREISLHQEHAVTQEVEVSHQWRERSNRLAALGNLESAMSRRIPILREDEGSSYANRVPQRQSLYDWAPGLED
jgi:hypothetical protein